MMLASNPSMVYTTINGYKGSRNTNATASSLVMVDIIGKVFIGISFDSIRTIYVGLTRHA